MTRAVTMLERPTRRAREVNWGDRTRLTGRETKTLAWVSVADSQSMVVYANAVVRGAGSSGIACVVNIEWGHGGASIAQDFPVVHRLRVPLAASMVKVSGRLLDTSGAHAPLSVSADVSVVIAPGLDGETLRNTEWSHDAGAEGMLSSGPARVMRIDGYSASAVDTWLMIFDGPATAGELPTIARPVRAGRPFSIRRFDSQPFRASVTWAASSTPITLTKDLFVSMRSSSYDLAS